MSIRSQRRRKPSPEQLQQVVDDFNKNYPVGTEVILERDSGPILTKVRYAAWILSGHSAVAMFEGVSGAHSIDPWRVRRAQGELF